MEITSDLKKVSGYFKLPNLGMAVLEKTYREEDKLHEPTIPVLINNYIFGVEVEVENVPDPQVNYKHHPYWEITTDGSLRNHGIEFVSVPLRMAQLEGAMIQLFDNSLPKNAEFSERTSIHVHMNVRDLQVHQIASLVLLYTAFENVLFNWVGEKRKENIFCIRLTDTQYAQFFSQINNKLDHVVDAWNKYTALNLLPIASKGTVEFRHMHGTSNYHRIMTWINIIACLKLATKRSTTQDIFNQITRLNTTSEYESFLVDIFGEYSGELLKASPNLQTDMEDSISYVKLLQIYQQDAIQPAPPVRNTQAQWERYIPQYVLDGVPPTNPQATIRDPRTMTHEEAVQQMREMERARTIRRTTTTLPPPVRGLFTRPLDVTIDEEVHLNWATTANNTRDNF